MTDGSKLALVAIFFMSTLSFLNSRAAHRNTHAIACSMGITDVCNHHKD